MGTKHTFASSWAVERRWQWEICHPRHHRKQIWNVRPPEHSRYLVQERSRTRDVSINRRKTGRGRGAIRAKWLLSNTGLFSGPVILCYVLPLHPHSICQVPQDVSKRFWIIDKPREILWKTDQYCYCKHLVTVVSFFKVKRDDRRKGGGGKACLC